MKKFWIKTKKCRLCVCSESDETLLAELTERNLDVEIEGECKPDESVKVMPIKVAEIPAEFVTVKSAPVVTPAAAVTVQGESTAPPA